ncbi:MAG: hypothetical protein WCY89_12350 [Flavobacteriaceae bacterium]
MKEIEKYVLELSEKANGFLKAEYNIDSFNISHFQSINFYLIDKALNTNKNLFIESFDKELPSISQFPTLLAAAISLFFKNYCDDRTTYKVGEILQKDGVRFEIIGVKDDGYKLRTNFKGGYSTEVSKKGIKKYIVTNADLSNRRVKTRFDDYKKLFNLVFETDYVPSKFSYKSAIILEKKEFDNEIKNQTYTDINILKAIPIRWISKNGTKSWNHIPIEPMILCVPDFETLEEYVLEKGIKIESLIVIGKNKYKDNDLTKIKRYLREGDIPNCVILGNEGFEDNNSQFIKWKWTYEEFALLEDLSLGRIESIQIQDSEFEVAINSYIDFLDSLETTYSINLNNIKTLRKFLYPLVLSKESNSRNTNQLDYVQHLMHKVSRECIVENLYNQNIDPGKEITNVDLLIDGIFGNFKNDKFRLLDSVDFDIIIVPEPLLPNWKNEFKSKSKLLSLKEFYKVQNSFTTTKRVLVLSLFGNGMQPFDVVRIFLNTKHNYKFLCYKEESEILENLKNRYFNEIIGEYTSSDREKITGIKYEISPIEIKVSDLIENLHDKSLKDKKEYNYEDTEQINYEIEFEENCEIIISDGSKNVLLLSNNNWTKSKVSNLIQKDRVRIYNNLSKDKLFEIAAQQDTKGRFNKVDSDSKIWKEALMKYFNQKTHSNPFYTETDLMKALQKSGLTISNPLTIKKWLTKDDKERFPNSANNLIAIKSTLNDPILNDNFESIKRSKRFYRGIMISLGRDLSDDVMEYIVSGGKSIGKILSNFTKDEIEIFIQRAAPESTIKNISITEEDESI